MGDLPPPPPRGGPPAPRLRPEPPVPLGTCSTPCRFYDPASGTCRRHAPMRLDVPGHPNALWPRVAPADWCGKWEPPFPGDTTRGT